jgi:hypothetical protein
VTLKKKTAYLPGQCPAPKPKNHQENIMTSKRNIYLDTKPIEAARQILTDTFKNRVTAVETMM